MQTLLLRAEANQGVGMSEVKLYHTGQHEDCLKCKVLVEFRREYLGQK